MFLERGYDATSMTDLATAAGLSKAGLYHHVTGREDVLRRGIPCAIDAYSAVFDEPRSGPDVDPVDRLRHVVARTVVVISALLPETALLIRARGNTGTEQWAPAQRRALNARMAVIIAAAWDDAGRTPPVDAATAARLVLGTTTSSVDCYRATDGPLDPDALARTAADLLLPGLMLLD